jgi:hypothetical protein
MNVLLESSAEFSDGAFEVSVCLRIECFGAKVANAEFGVAGHCVV